MGPPHRRDERPNPTACGSCSRAAKRGGHSLLLKKGHRDKSRALIDKNTGYARAGQQPRSRTEALSASARRQPRCTFRNPVAIANLRGLNPSLSRVHSTHVIVPTALPLRLAAGDAPVHEVGVAARRFASGRGRACPAHRLLSGRLASPLTYRRRWPPRNSVRMTGTDMRHVVVHEVAAMALHFLSAQAPDNKWPHLVRRPRRRPSAICGRQKRQGGGAVFSRKHTTPGHWTSPR